MCLQISEDGSPGRFRLSGPGGSGEGVAGRGGFHREDYGGTRVPRASRLLFVPFQSNVVRSHFMQNEYHYCPYRTIRIRRFRCSISLLLGIESRDYACAYSELSVLQHRFIHWCYIGKLILFVKYSFNEDAHISREAAGCVFLQLIVFRL